MEMRMQQYEFCQRVACDTDWEYRLLVHDEKRFVTGQNQNSSHETAQKIMAILDH